MTLTVFIRPHSLCAISVVSSVDSQRKNNPVNSFTFVVKIASFNVWLLSIYLEIRYTSALSKFPFIYMTKFLCCTSFV